MINTKLILESIGLTEAKEYKYGCSNRPPMFASPDGAIKYEPKEGYKGGRQDSYTRHGVIYYDRELTDKEIDNYELYPLENKAYLERYWKKIWDDIGDYAKEYGKIAEKDNWTERDWKDYVQLPSFGPIHEKEYQELWDRYIAKAKSTK